MSVRKVAQVVCILALLGASVFGQDMGAINGQVFDPTKAAVPSATVEAVNQDTSFSRKAVSNPEGAFFIRALPPGRYNLIAQVSGFKTFTQTGIQVSVGQNTRADVRLEVGAVTESVTVQAIALGVDTQGSTVGATIDRQRLASLPLLDRNVLTLATMLPGVGPASFPTTVTYSRAGPGVSVSGGRLKDNNFMLDGASITTGLYGTSQNLPSPDALEEFRILTNTYTAEFGQGVGSVFLAVTKSGTNTPHGNLYEYLRNDALNARNTFAITKPYLRQNQFGGSIGAPVRLPYYNGKDQTFFFVSYQGLRIGSQSLTKSFPPTALERLGDFSAYAKAIRDPSTGQPFPGNKIPTDRLDPLSLNMLKEYMPLYPNQPDGQNLTLRSSLTSSNQITVKGDQRLSSTNNLSVRFYRNLDGGRETTPGNLFPLAEDREQNLVQTITASDTHSFSPTVLNELRLSYTRVHGATIPSLQKSAKELGGKFNQQTTAPMAPKASISGRAGMSSSGPRREVDNIFQAEEKLSWMRGRHSLKFGWAGIYHRQLTGPGVFQSCGNFTFDGSFTDFSLADYMIGKPNTLQISNVYYAALQGSEYAAYVQDDFTVSRRLTLNFGVRYQLHVPWTNKFGYAANIIPGRQSIYIPKAPPGILYYGDPGIPAGLYNTNKKNFEPRFGFAWDVFGTGRTAVRAGYGLLTRGQAGILVQHGFEHAPFQRTLMLSPPASFSDPHGGGPDPFPYLVDIKNPIFAYPMQAFMVDLNFKDAYTQQFNLNVQQQIGSDVFIQVGYVGKVAHRLPQMVEVNAAVYGPGATAANTQQRRPFYPQNYGGITKKTSVGNSNYHSLQVEARKRYSHGLTLQTAYTWSKSIDNGSFDNAEGAGSISNPYDFLKGERGLSDFDRRHIFNLNGVWDLPVFSGERLPARVFGGWQLSGVLRRSSGSPFSVVTGRDTALLGATRGLGGQRANQVGDPFMDTGRPRQELIARYFNTAAFASPATGTFGNSGRNILTGPGNFTADVAILKNFQLSSRESLGKIQFRAEAYNLLNWVNLGNPAAFLTAMNYGQINGAGAARVLQFGLRYDF